jgi:hypothetical protein
METLCKAAADEIRKSASKELNATIIESFKEFLQYAYPRLIEAHYVQKGHSQRRAALKNDNRKPQ